MKRLILLRHGKSAWDKNLPDQKRPLKSRAFEDVEHVANAFQNENNYFFTMYSSPAIRAQTTAKLFAEKLKDRVEAFHIKEEFYTFDASEVVQLVFNLPDDSDNILLVGHNPAYTQLINYFCEDANIDNLPTTGLVELQFKAKNWNTIKNAKLSLSIFPKNLRD